MNNNHLEHMEGSEDLDIVSLKSMRAHALL